MQAPRALALLVTALALVSAGCLSPENEVQPDAEKVGSDTLQEEVTLAHNVPADTTREFLVNITETTRLVEASITVTTTDFGQNESRQGRDPYNVTVRLVNPLDEVLDEASVQLPDPQGLQQDVTLQAELTGREAYWDEVPEGGVDGIYLVVESQGAAHVVGWLRSYE